MLVLVGQAVERKGRYAVGCEEDLPEGRIRTFVVLQILLFSCQRVGKVYVEKIGARR